MPAVAPGKGKSKDGNYISQEAQWLASGGVETERGAGPSVSDLWAPSESLRASPNVSSASSASERSALLELSPRAPGALHPLSPIPPTSAMLRAVQGTAHGPARGTERDWPDTRCQVAKQRSEPRAELREGGRLEVAERSGRALKAAARRSAWKCGGELGLLPKSK